MPIFSSVISEEYTRTVKTENSTDTEFSISIADIKQALIDLGINPEDLLLEKSEEESIEPIENKAAENRIFSISIADIKQALSDHGINPEDLGEEYHAEHIDKKKSELLLKNTARMCFSLALL